MPPANRTEEQKWYVPDHINANFKDGDTANGLAPWEGIGTGWFYSVLGGGYEERPYDNSDADKKGRKALGDNYERYKEDYLDKKRQSVYDDNTVNRRMRGDYAVPTLFNGNFDAITLAKTDTPEYIPGWSFYYGANSVTQNNALQQHLVTWEEIGNQSGDFKDYLTKINSSPSEQNYALKLGGSDGARAITHNYFIMPEWGELRFNLHVPQFNSKVSLQVSLQGENGVSISETFKLQEADGTISSYTSDKTKIGYGKNGFETFRLNISPEDKGKIDALRNQRVTLTFQLVGLDYKNAPVYLDDIFFKSDELRLGNPTDARTDAVNNPTNFLIEKAQYSVSYNNQTNTANCIMPNVDPRKFPNNQLILKNGTVINLSSPGVWETYAVTVDDVEALTGYNFFSQLPEELQNTIEARRNTSFVLNAPLLADTETQFSSLFPLPPLSVNELPSGFEELSIGQNNTNSNEIAQVKFPDSPSQINVEQPSDIKHIPSGSFQVDVSHIAVLELGITHFGTSESSPFQINGDKVSFLQKSTIQIDSSPVGFIRNNRSQISFGQVSPFQVNSIKPSIPQCGSGQISPTEVGFSQKNLIQVNSRQINSTQIHPLQVNPSKISLPSSIPLKQFLDSYSHTSTPASTNTYKDNRLNLWSTLFDPTNPFDLTFQIQDLPKGQLAEAQITKFDSLGRPIGGTIEVDPTANGMGWFIDPTPFDNSEFSQTLTNTAFRATSDSAAYGHYDLLTALLHSMGHLEGFINGYNGFDHHIQTVNGSKLFVGDNFSATLTPDGSHLDSKVYPYDLMNPTLTPGVRKLPSTLDAQIINAASNHTVFDVTDANALNAPLTSLPLTDILNGKFDISDTTDPNYGWTTRGAATVLSFEAVLTEDSPLNSEFKQTFTVPQGAKYLQFTLKNTTLGDDSALAPGDAFEVALLDANEKTSLVDTANGLTQTDALLNIQHDGKAYISNKVILPATVAPNTALSLHSPMTFKVDLSGIPVGTAATLYFDRLGFGKRDAKVTIDNVQLLNDLPHPPVANNDTATTDQTKPTIINVFANDTDKHSPIDPLTLTIGTNPTYGTVNVNPDGTITYTPATTFVGTDTFTYTVADNSGTTSDPATVSVQVNNVAPTITEITGDTTTNEGATVRNTLKGIGASAALLADIEPVPVLKDSFGFNNQLPTWQNSVAQVDTIQQSTFPSDTSQISTSQIDAGHIGTIQISTPQVGITEVGTQQISTKQISTAQVSTSEVNTRQVGIFQISTAQVGIGNVGFLQPDA